MATIRVAIDNYREHHVTSPKLTRLTPQQMDEIRAKGLSFSIVTTSTIKGINVVRRNYST